MTDIPKKPVGFVAELLAEALGENAPSTVTAPKMSFVLRALEDTRVFLEERFEAALDANDRELADAYRYSLQHFRYAILNASANRGMRYLADWAYERAKEDNKPQCPGTLEREGLPPFQRCKLAAGHPGDCEGG